MKTHPTSKVYLLKLNPIEKKKKPNEQDNYRLTFNQMSLAGVCSAKRIALISFSVRLFCTPTRSPLIHNMPPVSAPNHVAHYDLIVIGGGSGGLAASKEAVKYGKKVALIDFVKPTPLGTTWGIGGTCVNVGCIPKKLMHEAALVGERLNEAHYYGWVKEDGEKLVSHGSKPNLKVDWSQLVERVQAVIKSSNFKYRVELRNKKVEYLNSYAKFVDKNTLELEDKKGVKSKITGTDIIIATGERPRYPTDCKGAIEHSITSDDLFSLPHPPGKTLVVGASYVALECAGFLNGLGFDVTVAVRSILLRGFDQQMAEIVGSYMSSRGVKFSRPAVPEKIEKIRDGQPGLYRVTTRVSDKVVVEDYNTIVFAIGRESCTKDIAIENSGVIVNPKTGKIPTKHEKTNIENIYAIGDVLEFRTELTPVAIDSGILLAKRLYGGSKETFDYETIPTTVFTPLEYGCVGVSEEAAIKKYGQDNIEVFHTHFKPFELGVTEREVTECYAKIICLLNHNLRIIGIHYAGPNAGEVIQFATGVLKADMVKKDMDKIVRIHPTSAEILLNMQITKRSGESPIPQGCCG